MEQHQSKKMTIEVDQRTYEMFKEYCEETNSDKSDIMEGLMQYFLEESMNTMDAMRKGYAEMASINLEISSEFNDCEDEAHSRF